MTHPFIHVPTVVPGFKEFALTALAQQGSNSVYTFEDMVIGAPAPGRLIIVTMSLTCGSTGRSVTDVTIGGNAATIDVMRVNTGNSLNGTVAVASLVVPTGTTADIVVTLSGTNTGNIDIAIYRANKLASTTVFDIAPDTDIDNQNSMSVNVPSQGIVVAVASKINDVDATWTGVTRDYMDDSTGHVQTMASRRGIAATTGYAVSIVTGQDPSRYACASYG